MANPILTVPKHTETWWFLQLQLQLALLSVLNARDWVLSCIYSTAKLSPYWSLLAHPARGAYLGFHVATKSITTPSCMGCQSIARLPLSISSGFPENSPEAIYTPGWRERHCERKVSCPRTQNIDPARSRTQTSWPKVLCTDRLATVSSV